MFILTILITAAAEMDPKENPRLFFHALQLLGQNDDFIPLRILQ